ncbi:RNA-guided endonuclease TnpB family protein [Limosilactobacillus pontis]|uniref:RNA-guided endonuclease TnpB family protein n=1 Tax=Limosilactobacillus pontis TaxID=35787 RepID=UPI002247BEA2|nr:RNA-guided endonuclease TnpB family protein [Limosilactobacillus pontis]
MLFNVFLPDKISFHISNRVSIRKVTTPNVSIAIFKVIDDHHIKLPKLGAVYFCSGRLPQGKIKNVTVRLTVANQYYITVLAECENQALPKTGKYVGGDLGLKALLNLSDGYKEPIQHFEDKYRKKLHHWEKLRSRRYLLAKQAIAWDHHNNVLVPRQLSDFKNYQKARVMVAKYRQKIANQRLNQLQKFTTKLVKQYDTIVLEKLNVKGMMKNHKLARAIANASWSRLVAILQYKCDWYGKQLIQVNSSYTSQICANCGQNNHRLGLSKSAWLAVRKWNCPNCGKHLDRDINAAKVILSKGLAIQ